MPAIKLYKLSWQNALHKIAYDLSRELVVGICTLVLFATFFYVFQDFINSEVKAISQGMGDVFARVASCVILGMSFLGCLKALRKERYGEQSIARAATFLGESPGHVKAFAILYGMTAIGIWHGLAWGLTIKYFLRPPIFTIALAETLLILCSLLLLLPRPGSGTTQKRARVRPLTASASTISSMRAYRLKSIFTRSRPCQLGLFASLATLALIWLARESGLPSFVQGVLALIAGIFAAMVLLFQLSEDLASAWMERSCGVSHAEFVRCYRDLGMILGTFLSLGITLVIFLSPLEGREATWYFQDSWKIVVMPLIATFAVHGTMFQIDGRRPLITTPITAVVALFLGTAVLAHWASLILLPILSYYGRQTQENMYYRA